MKVLRRIARSLGGPVGSAIEGRLGGYRVRANVVDEQAPEQLASPRKVAVIGGGLAGIAAASTLASRGFQVVLFEAGPRIGGKIGGERILVDGTEYSMDHGFHAFFRHYYNLNAFLESIAVRQALVPIDDYAILDRDGRTWSFGDVATTPGLNLLDLAGKDLYRLSEVLFSRARRHMHVFLEYDRHATFSAFDRMTFSEWADAAGLPAKLRRVLTIFARAFFAEDTRVSAAEVVKAFHFYYLAHDHGLLYDHPSGSYAEALIDPIEAHLCDLGVALLTRTWVRAVAPQDGGVAVDGMPFDDVVLATPAGVARVMALRSPALRAACPDTTRRLAAMHDGQRYAVLRVWLDRDIRPGLPVFVATERVRLLDAVASYHRITRRDAEWVRERGGAVLELHSYAVPDDLPDDRAVRAEMLAELLRFFPELEGMEVRCEHLRVRDDFTALHSGMAASRPGTETEHPHVFLAGDWVSLPIPAMLMEGAFSSGLYAANAILRREGLRQVPIDSVPLRGLLAARERKREVRASAST